MTSGGRVVGITIAGRDRKQRGENKCRILHMAARRGDRLLEACKRLRRKALAVEPERKLELLDKGIEGGAGVVGRALERKAAVLRAAHSLAKLLVLAFNMLTNFSLIPLQVISVLGFFVSLCGLVVAAYYLVQYMLSNITVPGFASTIRSRVGAPPRRLPAPPAKKIIIFSLAASENPGVFTGNTIVGRVAP